MKRNLLFTLLAVVCCSFLAKAQSNLFIDTSYTVEEMMMDFFDDPDIVVSNVVYTGHPLAVGFFDGGGTDLGLDAGIVFCSGNVFNTIGPNSYFGISTNLMQSGDADIDSMGVDSMGFLLSNDAAIIEFDFTVSQSDSLHFSYVFGSDEYLEFVNSSFNDAFGFFISGPGINGPFSNNAENISLLPGTTESVAINNVNDQTNSQYFVDNTDGQHLEYDGLTTPLPASFYAGSGKYLSHKNCGCRLVRFYP